MPDDPRTPRLPLKPDVDDRRVEFVRRDYERFAEDGLPRSLEEYLLEEYGIDTAAEYAGFPLKNPWGKASGQLSMTERQVEEDVEAGLGFVVLKTVIAQDASGTQTMQDWAIKESRMVAERIRGASGEEGWTISWKGRGWWQSFDDYLQLIRNAQRSANKTRTLIVPSCKYHLPTPEEENWRVEEYDYTTRHLWQAWQEGANEHGIPMPLEKDFSPTLAGSDRASAQTQILEWLTKVPKLIRDASQMLEYPTNPNPREAEPGSDSPIRLGLKLFNSLFENDFQLEMLRTIHQAGINKPEFYIYGNRLFNPQREFDGHRGIAYGGPDLSDRNLQVTTEFNQMADQQSGNIVRLPWSATGNITTGKMALEYALRGASSFQLHTYFQLPSDQYSMKAGSKIQKAVHELYFHPETGFVLWILHLAKALGLPPDRCCFSDIVGKGDQIGLW